MRLLIVSQYFWPETFIINDLVRLLAADGHTVIVLTGKPNYPDGNTYPGYHAHGCQEEFFNGNIEVLRVPLRPRGAGAKNLFLNYCSFVWSGLVHFPRLMRGKEYDAILVFAPSPITSAIPAIWLRFLSRKYLAIWVQDLWPESLKATGFIRSPLLLRVAGWMVRAIYACTDTLLVQSRAFHQPVARYARADKIVYYPNSYPDAQPPVLTGSKVPADLLEILESDFCLVFAGNLGKAQSVATLLVAAERLKHFSDIRFVLVGSGSMLGWIEGEIKRLGLSNVILAGRFSPEDMPQFFARAAGLLVTLRREEILAYTIPSKVQAYLSAGRPIIAALDGEGGRVVLDAGAGLVCPAEDASGLAACIEALYRMSASERDLLGKSGREYFREHFEMSTQARRLIEILESRMKNCEREQA